MNPVSFYFCFSKSGDRVEAVVAEVNNTPWNEQHNYVLDLRGESGTGLNARCAKEFHVSPFLPMDLAYRWRLTRPGERLRIRIAADSTDGEVFHAVMELQSRPLTRLNLARAFLRYPLMTLQVFVGIYWQAWRLWRKRVTVHSHPRHGESTCRSETNMARPADPPKTPPLEEVSA